MTCPAGTRWLRRSRCRLEPFEGARELAELARKEIDDWRRGDDADLAVDVLGLLTAAAGAAGGQATSPRCGSTGGRADRCGLARHVRRLV